MFDIDIDTSGPLIDNGGAEAVRIIDYYLPVATHHIAETAKDHLVGRMAQVFRAPTPYYWTQLRTEPIGGGHRVHDGGMVYGPWLEGTGSRNFPVTRFRGYRSFRVIHGVIDGRAVQLAEEKLPPFLEMMGG